MEEKKKAKVGAVICEYNPLHQGHRFQIREIRQLIGEEGVILSLMSGDFVQRGEPAVYDKYDRAKAALSAGADLVLELPYPWSASVAECFASGAISILKDLGVVDSLFFGSEEKTGQELALYAERCATDEYRKALAQLRKEEKRLPFPKLNDLCYKKLYDREPELCANEILGTQYISEIHRQKAPISYQALRMLPGISASAIREELREQDFGASLEKGERAILTVLGLSQGKDRFEGAFGGCAHPGGYGCPPEKGAAFHRFANARRDSQRKTIVHRPFGCQREGQKIAFGYTEKQKSSNCDQTGPNMAQGRFAEAICFVSEGPKLLCQLLPRKKSRKYTSQKAAGLYLTA